MTIPKPGNPVQDYVSGKGMSVTTEPPAQGVFLGALIFPYSAGVVSVFLNHS